MNPNHDSPPVKESLVVHAYDWALEDGDGPEEHASIRAWCLDRESKPYLIRIEDFPVFCHIELPLFVNGRYFQWNQRLVDQFMVWLNHALQDAHPDKAIFKMAKKIYYYRGQRQYPMIMISFTTLEAMHKCENFLNSPRKVTDIGVVVCKVWETSISMIRKLLTVRDVKYSQWFTIQGYRADEDNCISTLEREYIADFRTMVPISAATSKGWMTRPGLLAFDIECYSPNHKAMPNKLGALHVAYMISLIYQRLGDPSSRRRWGIIIGDCNDVMLDATRPGPAPKKDEDPNIKKVEEVPGNLNVNIIRVANEVDMIHEMCRVIRETDPEIILGYNILNFDYPYLDARLKRRLKDWAPAGRIRGKNPVMNSRQWRSDAYGYVSTHILQIDGRISVDMLPLIKRDNKLDMYTLDFVTKNFLGAHRGKHDIKAEEMFQIYERVMKTTEALKEHPESPNVRIEYDAAKHDMTRVMRYCIEDSELVIDMFEKLHVWIGLVEMSNVVGVSIMDLFTRGQQVRCLSQIYDLAQRQGFVLDHRDQKAKKFSGAVVCDPVPGLYENIICLDFASLYPSIMQAFNICLTTLVEPTIADEIPDKDCHVIEFDQEEDISGEVKDGENAADANDDAVDDEERADSTAPTTPGKRRVHHRYKFIRQSIQEGIIPQLVRKLVEERSAVRVQLNGKKDEKTGQWIIPKETNPLIMAILDKRQLALKVTANSFFGFLGVQDGGKLPLIEGAMSITGKGRELITDVQKYLREKYNAAIIYGDSVPGYTPLLVRRAGRISWIPIQDLVTFASDTPEKIQMNVEDLNLEVHSDRGWTRIKRVIRHATDKNIYRVSTSTGTVDVTSDHSLLRPDGSEVSPTSIKVGDDLLHTTLPSSQFMLPGGEEQAWVWGLFAVSGRISPTWTISGQSVTLLRRAMDILHNQYPNIVFSIQQDSLVASGNCTDLIEDYRQLFYIDANRRIPDSILNADIHVKRAFLDGYCDLSLEGQADIYVYESLLMAGLFHLFRELGYVINLSFNGIYNCCVYKPLLNRSPREPSCSDKVKSISLLGPNSGFVYDLETENHHFGAGIGEMIVHNTDSCMVDMHITDPKECNRIGKELSEEISARFPKPLKMEFEKGMRKLLCIKKKMYIFTYVDKDGNDKRDDDGKMVLVKKGIAEARRDRCKWFRRVSDTILRLIMAKAPIADCMDVLVEMMCELFEGKVHYKDLLSIREIGSHYKNENYFMNVFANYLRSAGKIVTPGDRLAYLVVKSEDKNAKVGMRMRSEEIYLERLGTPQEEKIDYFYYLEHVVMNPIDLLFGVGYKKDLETLGDVGYKPNGRYHFKHIREPIKMMCRVVADGKDLRLVKTLLRPPIPKAPRLKFVDGTPVSSPTNSPMNSPRSDKTEEQPANPKPSPPSSPARQKVTLKILPC